MLILENFSVIRNGKRIVKDVNLEVRKNEIHIILGANGSGKSTLAQGIMGIYPTEGKILFENRDISSLPVYERARLGITLAFQEPARFQGLTVRDYLLLSSRDKSIHEVNEVTKKIGLPKTILFQEMDESLSGGERKRIELAAVLLMKPKIAILDEPDSGIDMLSFKRISNIIGEMKGENRSVILITHNEDMIEIGDRASIMCQGKIIKTGERESIRRLFKNTTPCPLRGVVNV